ncbi:MAG: hypothetical protein ACLFXM_06140 [Acidimicrobiia bacterium]
MASAKEGTSTVGRMVSRHSRLLLAGLATAAAAAAAAVVRRRGWRIDLPDPGPLAAETAVSVHNAAKAAVIAAVRESEDAGEQAVREAVRDAVAGGAEAGADVGAVVIGSVEGAVAVAPVLGVEPRHLASAAAAVAVDTAGQQGKVAGERARDLLEPVLPR